MRGFQKKCSEAGCESSFTPHRWAAEKRTESGWFHQRSGESWCPLHVPDWVAGWRKNK